MVNILIVDDEATICSGLKAMIGSLNLPEIGGISLAGGRKEALKIAGEMRPGIIISDICLIDGNGLALIRELEAACAPARFIVLSGYDNFEYAKEAIKLGVMDYLLKPASIEELEAVLKSAIGSLQKQRFQEETSSPANRKLILDNSLNRIFIASQLPDETINPMLDEIGIVFRHPFYIVIVTSFENNVFSTGASGEDDGSTPNIENGILSAEGIAVTAFHDYARNLVLLFNCPGPQAENSVLRFMRVLGKSFMQSQKGGFHSAMSASGKGAGSVNALYAKCKQALEYKILYQPYDVIPCSDIAGKSGGSISSGEELRELAGQMSSYKGNTKDISDFIDKLVNRETLGKYDIESIRQLYQQLIQIIGVASVDDGRPIGSGGAHRDFSSFSSLNDLRIYLKETAYDINGLMKTAQKERTVIDIAKRYVKENYGRSINLAVVANIVSMNYSYFSKLFKNRIGMNFSDYVMQMRMEEAKKLLADPVNRIFEISSRVGYDNPKHFARAFKGYAGVTPSEYQSGETGPAAQH